jgi:hypothetical protein
VSLSPGPIIPLNAASTAEAFVFLNPVFTSSDDFLAAHLLDVIHRDAQVQAFGQTITQIFGLAGDPVWSKRSCGFPVIEFQQASQTFAGVNLTRGFTDSVCRRGEQDDILLSLMVSFPVVMAEVIFQAMPQG